MNEHLKQFDIARQLYPGSKLGNANEFKNFVFRSMYPVKPKCKYDIKTVLPLLAPAIKRQIQWRAEAVAGDFRPPWKNFQTWVNDNYWEFEPPLVAVLHAPKTCHVCGGNPSGQTGGKWHCPEHNPYKVPKFKKYESPSQPPETSHNRSPITQTPVKPEEQGHCNGSGDTGGTTQGVGTKPAPILTPHGTVIPPEKMALIDGFGK